jgi:hypothetical protein
MTSLMAWIGSDSRGPASAYLCSDSRISWLRGGGNEYWDYGRKIFGCRTRPHVLGYCGDVLFPTQTLSQIVDMIDRDLLFDAEACAEPDRCASEVTSVLAEAFQNYPTSARQPFEVLYLIREGQFVPSRFHMRHIAFGAGGLLGVSRVPVPAGSGIVSILGSGREVVQLTSAHWNRTEIAGTSRAVFTAFCDALRSGQDALTGGPPQLAGLWRRNEPRAFGVIWNGRRFFCGADVEAAANNQDLRWYNELFEICDPLTLARRSEAQPQPRPKHRVIGTKRS